ncbi:hypothetical protein AJ79_10032 [Helicocarpus griseus UAMH5409]|uniref:Amino acid permease n=1 Tax=Helicocarpus griseus UAMH5409 TaxID=1447875 RepID=A0A2B7WG87_9EURO|nr:hypothetical protein AJ79_10032 [Helicocarpus griseus UAMH5409]
MDGLEIQEELKPSHVSRLFSFAQLLAFALTFMESWEVVAMNMGATLWNGGPQSLAWGCIAVVIGSLSQAMSMAELASIQPIAGAQYHWTALLAPKKQRKFVTWMQGWVRWFAWVTALAGSTSSEAAILQGLVSTSYPNYVPERWRLTLIMYALLISVGLINMYAFWLVPWLELASGVLHVILWLIFVVVMVTLGPGHKPDFVFLEGGALSGWGSSFVAFNLGMFVPAWGFIGFDGAVHMSEEVRKAKHAVPRTMIYTIIINGILAYGITLVLLFTMGNPESIQDSAYPIIPICLNATGSLKAATAMVAGLVIVTYCVIAASVASVSRITWAWARDGALPSALSHVHSRHKVPVRALWLPIAIVMLLALLNIGSTSATAFSAFTALSSFGLYSSYIIAVGVTLHARLTGVLGDEPNAKVRYGGWRLWNGWGTPVNIFALAWTAYLTVFLAFPTTLPVDGTNMNYALPIYAAVVLDALIWWFVWGKSKWPGLNMIPINRVEIQQ